jgi:hypothetical protein
MCAAGYLSTLSNKMTTGNWYKRGCQIGIRNLFEVVRARSERPLISV